MKTFDGKETIQTSVRAAVESFAHGFKARHEGEVDNPKGVINMKIHNVFIEALGEEVQYYTALVRSFDSSLGNTLEALAINIAKLNFEVKRNVQGPLAVEQTRVIAELLESYKRREKRPSIQDYQSLRSVAIIGERSTKRHNSDYYLISKETNAHFLIELKIGGDLDSKKARSEKEAILEQFAILSNTLPGEAEIRIFFGTAYNRYGEDQPWSQERVRQFFAADELLIGRDFWNLICGTEQGYQIVLEAYRESAHLIKDTLASIKKTYLG